MKVKTREELEGLRESNANLQLTMCEAFTKSFSGRKQRGALNFRELLSLLPTHKAGWHSTIMARWFPGCRSRWLQPQPFPVVWDRHSSVAQWPRNTLSITSPEIPPLNDHSKNGSARGGLPSACGQPTLRLWAAYPPQMSGTTFTAQSSMPRFFAPEAPPAQNKWVITASLGN